MDVFEFRKKLVSDYSAFTRSFTRIKADDVTAFINGEYNLQKYWPPPLVQVNPNFRLGHTIEGLASAGSVHRECARIFRSGKSSSSAGTSLRLFKHQEEAIGFARAGASYVLTTGTGSGKSLAYFVPIIDFILRDKEQDAAPRTRAIIIYPMNALANSQLEELGKFLFDYGTNAPVTYGRYTGQESDEERQYMAANPPDILLTNFMMLELLMTRQDDKDKAVIRNAKGLKFLVLDELHTYRGRQGADVALLVRRVREALSEDLQCIGTSATMATEGSEETKNAMVAEVASRIFGSQIAAANVITETLQRITPEQLLTKDVKDPLKKILEEGVRPDLTFNELAAHPLAVWIELNLGLTFEDNKWRRARPITLQEVTQQGRLVSLYDIENRERLFPAVDSRMKFCLLTLGTASAAEFVGFATQVSQLTDPRRRFSLSRDEFHLINPNTRTCPVFRSARDAELTKKLYRAAPVLIEEGDPEKNPWGIKFSQGLFNMASDSGLFHDDPETGRLPLYEAKMIHQFDHRWGTYDRDRNSRGVSEAEKADPMFSVTPRYWVDAGEVNSRLADKGWDHGWLMGWRDICRATDERIVIASVVPRVATGDTLLLMFPKPRFGKKVTCLLADQCSLVHDYVARQKVGGTHLKYHVKKQLPNLPPERYTEADLAVIVPRVLELTYTAHDLSPWAKELGYTGEPFPWNPDRRAVLRAELDAFYAKLYGLTRDELHYILDPADVMGENYPSETFRVLNNNELKQFGEYRTQRLVLEAWERLEADGLR